MVTIDYTLPAYWADFFVNDGDTEDLLEIESFLTTEGLQRRDFLCVEDDVRFSWENDSGNGLGGDVCTFTFIKH